MGKKSKSQKKRSQSPANIDRFDNSYTVSTKIDEGPEVSTVATVEDEFYDAESIATSSLNEAVDQPSESSVPSPIKKSNLSTVPDNEDAEDKKEVIEDSLLIYPVFDETNKNTVDQVKIRETADATISNPEYQTVQEEISIQNDEALIDNLNNLTINPSFVESPEDNNDAPSSELAIAEDLAKQDNDVVFEIALDPVLNETDQNTVSEVEINEIASPTISNQESEILEEEIRIYDGKVLTENLNNLTLNPSSIESPEDNNDAPSSELAMVEDMVKQDNDIVVAIVLEAPFEKEEPEVQNNEDGFDEEFDDFVEAEQPCQIAVAPSMESIDLDLVLQPISFDDIRDQAR